MFKQYRAKVRAKELVNIHNVIYSAKQNAKRYGTSSEVQPGFLYVYDPVERSSFYYVMLYDYSYNKFLNEFMNSLTEEERQLRREQHNYNVMDQKDKTIHKRMDNLEKRIAELEKHETIKAMS